jgi:hypothetical protein
MVRYHITSFWNDAFKEYLHSYISYGENLIFQWGWPTFKIWRKFWKPNYTKIVDVSWCAVSDASCESSAGVERVRLIIRRLLIHRPNISRLSYTLLYCILKMHNTFLMWLVAWRMGLSYHIAWLHCFTIALTWIDTYTLICIRICIKTDGSENE